MSSDRLQMQQNANTPKWIRRAHNQERLQSRTNAAASIEKVVRAGTIKRVAKEIGQYQFSGRFWAPKRFVHKPVTHTHRRTGIHHADNCKPAEECKLSQRT
jgi:hypothetical protein